MNAMREVARDPLTPGKPMGFNVVRVPFFLEPDYPTGEEFEETNRVRLLRKWGGQAGWDAQKRRHGMKERGREVRGTPRDATRSLARARTLFPRGCGAERAPSPPSARARARPCV